MMRKKMLLMNNIQTLSQDQNLTPSNRLCMVHSLIDGGMLLYLSTTLWLRMGLGRLLIFLRTEGNWIWLGIQGQTQSWWCFKACSSHCKGLFMKALHLPFVLQHFALLWLLQPLKTLNYGLLISPLLYQWWPRWRDLHEATRGIPNWFLHQQNVNKLMATTFTTSSPCTNTSSALLLWVLTKVVASESWHQSWQDARPQELLQCSRFGICIPRSQKLMVDRPWLLEAQPLASTQQCFCTISNAVEQYFVWWIGFILDHPPNLSLSFSLLSMLLFWLPISKIWISLVSV